VLTLFTCFFECGIHVVCSIRAALAKHAALKLDANYTMQGVQWHNDTAATVVCQELFTWANALIEVCMTVISYNNYYGCYAIGIYLLL
jgi:hypothetical protein